MLRELQALRELHGSGADVLAAATLSGRGGAEQQQQVVRRVCLKRPAGGASGGGSSAAKNVSFVLEPQLVRVMLSPVVVNTRGRLKGEETTLPGAEVGGGEHRHRARVHVGGDSAGEAGADAPIRRSRRNVVDLGVGVEQVAVGVRNSANAEVEDELGEEVDRNRKRKSRENVEDIVVAAQVGVPRRSARSSGPLSAAPFVSSPVVEKKRGRRKAGGLKEQTCVEEQLAEVQDLGRTLRSGLVTIGTVLALPIVVETKRSRRLVQEEEPAVQKVAKVELSGMTTRSRSAAAAVMSPIVVENKRRKTEDAHSDGELPTVLGVPTNNALVARVLRNIAVQVNSIVVEETHFGKILENKRQPSRPATRSRRHQQLASSVEEKCQEQVAAPFKGTPLRRSRRNHSNVSELLLHNETTSESNNCSRTAEEGNDLKISRPSTHSAAKVGVEDNVAKAYEHLELRKRNPQNGRAKGCGGSAEEQVVGVVVRKGCLKRSGGGASSGSSGPAKKVTFVLEKHTKADAEAELGVRGRCWMTWSPAVAKTRGRRNAWEALPVAEVSGGERPQTRVRVGGDSVGEGDAGEAGADAPVSRSRRNAVNLGAGDGAEKAAGCTSRNNSTNTDEEEEDVGEAVDRKQKTRENTEDVVINSEVGVSRRSIRSSVLLSKAAFLWSLLLGRTEDGGMQEM